jgi:hypothetical protein
MNDPENMNDDDETPETEEPTDRIVDLREFCRAVIAAVADLDRRQQALEERVADHDELLIIARKMGEQLGKMNDYVRQQIAGRDATLRRRPVKDPRLN